MNKHQYNIQHRTKKVKPQTDYSALALELLGSPVERRGKEWVYHCPFHDDTKPSFYFNIEKGAFKCFGCGEKGGISRLRELLRPAAHLKAKSTLYEIRAKDGTLVAIHKRIDFADGTKKFHWLKPDGSISQGDIKPALLPLYGIHELNSRGFVVVTEGEKARDALSRLGVPAVGTVCGAATTLCDESLCDLLDVEIIYLWPDNDDAGRQHMERIARRLWSLGAKSVRIATWGGGPVSGDAYDLVSQYNDDKDAQKAVYRVLETAQEWRPPEAISYEELLATFRKWLEIPSDMPVRFMLCTVIANRLPGDPLWTFIIGASGDGKTELVNPLTGLDFVKPLDTLTVNTFLSGKQKQDPNASLLLRLPPGAILLMRDFSSVLEMHREARDEIFSQLRRIYDGHLTRATGEGGESAEIAWSGKVGFVACITSAIEDYRSFVTTLGERFLYYRLPENNRIDVAQAARRNRASLSTMRNELKEATQRFFAGLQIPETVTVPDEIGDWIVHVADFVSIARSSVKRDWHSAAKEIIDIPDPEVPTRLSQQLDLITCAHAVLMGRDHVEPEDLELTRQVALSCIPAARRTIIELLSKTKWALTTTEVANSINLPSRTAARYLEDLFALKLVERHGEGVGEAFQWSLSEFARQRWSILTCADTLGEVQKPVPNIKNTSKPQTSSSEYREYSYTGGRSKEEGVLGGADIYSAPPKTRLGTESLSSTEVSPRVPEDTPEDLSDDEIPF